MHKQQNTVSWRLGLAMLFTTFSVLVLQIAVTRVMSATATYHSAFAVLAAVMLGLAVSALSVFRDITEKEEKLILEKASWAAIKASIAGIIVVFVFIQLSSWGSNGRFHPAVAICCSLLFYFSFFYTGYIVAALLSIFAHAASRLYCFDLLGAALGCIAVPLMLNHASAFHVILLSTVITAAGGMMLAREFKQSRLSRFTFASALAAAIICGAAFAMPQLVRPGCTSESCRNNLIWERWHSLARVAVYHEAPTAAAAVKQYQQATGGQEKDLEHLKRLWASGWGMSPAFKDEIAPLLWMDLDSGASTQIIGYDSEKQLEFLKWDVTAAAYWLKDEPLEHTFIVGGGGGRDLLTAKQFGAKRIDVVELNPYVIEAVQKRFQEFSGKPYDLPGVHLTIGEARSILSQTAQQYDLIQMSMIDTFASSVSGSLVLSEHSLYTTEAFDLFLNHLKPNGMLSVSRWYLQGNHGELARVLRLAFQALRESGVLEPVKHVAVVYNQGYLQIPVVTCIIKRFPFQPAELERLKNLASRMHFQILWPELPEVTKQESLDIQQLLTAEVVEDETKEFDFSAPTDDRPFFFNTRTMFASWLLALQHKNAQRGSKSTVIIGSVLLLILFAGRLLLVEPLGKIKETLAAQQTFSADLFRRLTIYFAGIGFGFMLVELSIIQRYILFLGHPTYAISVVLFSLLLFSAWGSKFSESVEDTACSKIAGFALLAVLSMIMLTALAVPPLLNMALSLPLYLRVLIATGFLCPLGLSMGMILPLGIRIAACRSVPQFVPYLWGINGVCSVLASILGMGMAIRLGYTSVLICAALAYTVALCSLGFSKMNESTVEHC